MTFALLLLHEGESSFYNLRATVIASVKEQLRQLLLYSDDYWMNSVPLEMWGVHGRHQYTNNACDGTYVLSLARLNYDLHF
jgi:hypothetical protein